MSLGCVRCNDTCGLEGLAPNVHVCPKTQYQKTVYKPRRYWGSSKAWKDLVKM